MPPYLQQAERTRSVVWVLLIGTIAWFGGCSLIPATMTGVSSEAPMRFLGPDDFAGGFTPSSGPAELGLQSTYSGSVVVSMIDRTVVEKVLPTGVHLANPVVASTKHPVIHLIGEQREPSTLYNGNPVPVPEAEGYREMILLVPFVVRGSSTQWHNYIVRMYLDDLTAVAGGNSIYGYEKVWARLGKTETSAVTTHQVTTLLGFTTWFLNELQVTGTWGSLADPTASSLPRWADLKKIFEMPVLGSFNGVFICSYWEWDFAGSEVAPAASKHQVVTKFRDGMEEWETMGPLVNALDGAFSIGRVRWRLAPPPGCQP